MNKELKKDPTTGRLLPGTSGRQVGSKNKLTLLKVIAETAARERNEDKLQEVIDVIINKAKGGDIGCMKLVWQAIMSQGLAKDTVIKETAVINITTVAPQEERKEKIIEAEVVFKPTYPDGYEEEEDVQEHDEHAVK